MSELWHRHDRPHSDDSAAQCRPARRHLPATQSGDAVRLVCEWPPTPIHPQFVLALRREKAHLLADLRHKFSSVIDETVFPQRPTQPSKETTMTKPTKPTVNLARLLKRHTPVTETITKVDDKQGAADSIRQVHRTGGERLRKRNIYAK